MKQVILTGGIATGKSTVSNYLLEKGYPVIDTDILSRQAVEPGSKGLSQIVADFGPQVLTPEGNLDRDAVARLVFQDSKWRDRLNQIVHPLVFKATKAGLDDYRQAGAELVFVDMPLYFEVGVNYLDQVKPVQVWLVYVDEDTQLKRLLDRNHYDLDHAKDRIASQYPIEEKAQQADVVIDNRGIIENTLKQVDQALTELI